MDSAAFSSIYLPGVLIIIMFGIGLALEKKDFENVVFYPRAILIGLTAQMAILPAIAFLMVCLTNLPPVVKVGFILIAACPGGSASNLVAHLLRGNVALCISLTAVNSILILVTLPLIVNLGLLVFIGETHEIALPLSETILKIFYTTLIPTFLGVFIRHKNLNLAMKMEKPMRVIMTLLLFSVFAALIISEEQTTGEGVSKYTYLFPYAIALNFVAMAAGYFFSRKMGLDNRNNYTISIQVGLQNSALAIFVAGSLLGHREMAMVAVVYSSFTFFSTLLFGYIAKRFG
ncbi:MAG: bile acid:sodium symporter family protein [Bacteroidales bacterium]